MIQHTETTCRACRGKLIGKEIPRGVCGHCSTSVLFR